MAKKNKIVVSNLYGFVIDFSFIDATFQPPYHVETIDTEYTDITHEKKLLPENKKVKKRYRKDKKGNVFFRMFSLINL